MRALAVVFASLAFVSGCKRASTELVYERVALPGLSLELPEGQAMSPAAEGSQYTAGAIKRGRVRQPLFVAAVSWQPGTLSTGEEFDQLVQVMADAIGRPGIRPRVLGKREDKLGGQPAMRASVDLDMPGTAMKMEMIEGTCGARSITIVAAAPKGAAEMGDRIAASFECAPDAAREAEIAQGKAGPVAYDQVAPGWMHVENPDAYTLSDGTSIVMFTAAPDVASLDKLGFEKVITSMMDNFLGKFTSSGTEKITKHGSTREMIFGTAVIEGETSGIIATVWSCSAGAGVLSIGMHSTDTPRDAAVDMMMRARCLKPGEKPPEVPKAPAEPAPAEPAPTE